MKTRPFRHEFFSLDYSLHKLFFQTFSKEFFFSVFRPPQFLFVCFLPCEYSRLSSLFAARDISQKRRLRLKNRNSKLMTYKSDSVELGDVTLSRDSPCQATHLLLLSCIIYNWRKGSFQKCMIALLTEKVFGGSLPMDQ